MPPDQHWYCVIERYLNYSSCLASNTLLVSMTTQRFYSIIQPLKAASVNTVGKTRKTVLFICLFSCLYCIPFFFVAGNIGQECVSNLIAHSSVYGELYHWCTEVLTYILPFFSLLLMNSVIIHTLRLRSKLNLTDSGNNVKTKGLHNTGRYSERQVITMIFLVTFAFLILNVPSRALDFYLLFSNGGDTPGYYAGFHLFYHLGNKSCITNHGINFFLYALSGKKFRTDLKNLFCPKSADLNGNIQNSSAATSTVSVSDGMRN